MIIFLFLIIIINIIAYYAAYIWAPPEATLGESSRILYMHVPSAWLTYLSFVINLIASILYLRSRKQFLDTMAEVGAYLGLLFGAVTLIGGAIWSNAAWGAYWNWDPRQTTTLILWIAYFGYVSLRASIDSMEKRANIAAIYGIVAFATVPLSYVSIIYWQTLHPQIVTPGGISMTPRMVITLLLNLAAATMLYTYIYRLFYKIRSVEVRLFTYREMDLGEIEA